MKKIHPLRLFLYFLGMIVLALGISLNAQTTLGVSPIVSVAYCIATITGNNFGNMTFLVYTVLVIIEIIVHLCRKLKSAIYIDLLQLVVSVIFTRFLNIFNDLIPNLGSDAMQGTWAGSLVGRLFFLIIAIILTGIGAALTLNMRLVPNPGDGIVQTIGDAVHKGNGFIKNCLDITCVSLTCIIGLVVLGHLVGVGIGTIMAMIGVGRVIALFNYLTKAKTDKLIEQK